MALNSSAVSAGDLALAQQLNDVRDDATSTSSGHVHDGSLGLGSSKFALLVAGVPLDLQNTTDAASNEVAQLGGGNRATPADNDEAYIKFDLDDDLGAQTEFVRLTWTALDVSNGSKDSRPEFDYYTANTLRKLLFPAITAEDTVAVLALAQTLTNKTLTSPVINTQVSGSALATVAETDTGTSAVKVVTPDGLAGSIHGTRIIEIFVFNIGIDAATGDGKAWFRIPASLNGMDIVTVHAEVATAGTTNTLDIQLRNATQTADILSTKLTVDTGETGSDTAATPAVINTSEDDLQTNDVIFVDIDAIHTTASKGLIVTLEVRLP